MIQYDVDNQLLLTGWERMNKLLSDGGPKTFEIGFQNHQNGQNQRKNYISKKNDKKRQKLTK